MQATPAFALLFILVQVAGAPDAELLVASSECAYG